MAPIDVTIITIGDKEFVVSPDKVNDLVLNYYNLLQEESAMKCVHDEAVKVLLAVPPEVQEKIDALDEAFSRDATRLHEEQNVLREVLTQYVLGRKESVNTEKMKVTYVKGHPTWDGKMLEGMMAVVPGIEKARSMSKPFVKFG